jgi:hypothetical protein
MKPIKYKVWIHIEGLNKDGDCIEGDDYFEPREAGCFKYKSEALMCCDNLLFAADLCDSTGKYKRKT